MSEFSADTLAQLEGALLVRMARFDPDDLETCGEDWLREHLYELTKLEAPENGWLGSDYAWNRISAIAEALQDVSLLGARYSMESPHCIEIPGCPAPFETGGDMQAKLAGTPSQMFFEEFCEAGLLQESEAHVFCEAFEHQVIRSHAAWLDARGSCRIWELMREADFYYAFACWQEARNQLLRLGF